MSVAYMQNRPSYEDLEEEIIQLKHELGLSVDANKVAKLRHRLRVSPGEAKILLALYLAKGPIRTDVLNRLCSRYPDTDVDGTGTAVRISCIRRLLGHEFIDTYKGFGYALSFIGRERIAEVLNGE